MIIPVDEKLFIQEAKILLEKYFNISDNKKIVIDQGANFWNPESSLRFYDNAKLILITRDPRSVFSSMKKRKSLAYPGHDVKVFINWYQSIMNEFKKVKKSKNIKVIKYENFIINYHKEKRDLLNFIGLKNHEKFKYDIGNSEKNIFKAKKVLSTNELNIIKTKLKSHLQWPVNFNRY